VVAVRLPVRFCAKGSAYSASTDAVRDGTHISVSRAVHQGLRLQGTQRATPVSSRDSSADAVISGSP